MGSVLCSSSFKLGLLEVAPLCKHRLLRDLRTRFLPRTLYKDFVVDDYIRRINQVSQYVL